MATVYAIGEKVGISFIFHVSMKLLMVIQGGGHHQGCEGLAECQVLNLNYHHKMLRTFSMELG